MSYMTDHGNKAESTVSWNGITVYQAYQKERFGVPTVVLKLVSDRDDSAEVRMTVTLPPDLNIEGVGFHPDYGRENWTVDSGRLEFATELDPGEEVTTMYAVESLATDQLDSLLDSLTVEQVAGEMVDATADQHSATQSDRSASPESVGNSTTGDREPLAEAGEGSRADDGTAGIEEAEAGGPATEDDLGLAEIDDGGGPDSDLGVVGENEGEDEEEAEDEGIGVGGEDEDEDEDGIGVGGEDEGHSGLAPTDVDLSRTSDAAAGSEHEGDGEGGHEPAEDRVGQEEVAAEAEERDDAGREEAVAGGGETGESGDGERDEDRPDERETGEGEQPAAETAEQELSGYPTAELVSELGQRVQAGEVTDEDQNRLQELLPGQTEGATISDETRVAHLQKRVSDIEATVQANADQVADLSPRLGGVEDDVDSLSEGQDALEGQVEDLSPRLGDVEGDIDALSEGQDALEDQVEDLSPRLGDIEDDIDALAEGQDALEAELSTVQEWRDRVRSTLGALGDQ